MLKSMSKAESPAIIAGVNDISRLLSYEKAKPQIDLKKTILLNNLQLIIRLWFYSHSNYLFFLNQHFAFYF